MKITKIAFTLAATFSFSIPAAQAKSDQVVVIEDLSRSELRREIKLIEQEIYAMFNANEEDPEFHISCNDIVYTGTHLPEQACEPKFLIDARSDNATDVQFGTDSLSTTGEIALYKKKEMAQLSAKMDELAKENSNFAQLVMILNKLNARLAQLI